MYIKTNCILKLADTESTADANAPVWVHVATEGLYRGYRGGLQPFEFSGGVFDSIVKNIRSHPSFATGADGFGTVGIVPWDFNHASEQSPTEGSGPVLGAPAQAWTLDADVRQSSEGKAELWVLTQFLETALGYVRSGQYKWSSVAVAFEGTDPISNQQIGPHLTSIAMTNTPFIEGMHPLAASKNGVKARGNFFEPAKDPSDALMMMRELFGLPATTGVAEVIEQLGLLQQWVAAGSAPPGVDISPIFGDLRTIIGLPVTATESEVLMHSAQLMDAFTAGLQTDSGDNGAETPGAADAVASKETDNMELLKILAAMLGVSEKDTDIKYAIEGLIELRANTLKSLNLTASTPSLVLLETAAKDDKDKKQKFTSLEKLLEAMGVDNAQAALAAIPKLRAAQAQVAEMSGQLEEALAAQVVAEEDKAEEDVAAAMTSHNLPELSRVALNVYRGVQTDRSKDPKERIAQLKSIKTDVAAHLVALRKSAESFALSYPSAAPQHAHLTQTHLAGPTGVQHNLVPVVQASVVPAAPRGNGTVINLAQYVGRNKMERMMEHVKATNPSATTMTHEQLCSTAMNLNRDKNVQIVG